MHLFILIGEFGNTIIEAKSEKQARELSRLRLGMGRLPNNTIVREIEIQGVITQEFRIKVL